MYREPEGPVGPLWETGRESFVKLVEFTGRDLLWFLSRRVGWEFGSLDIFRLRSGVSRTTCVGGGPSVRN